MIRPRLCRNTRPGPVRKRFIRDNVQLERSKPGCLIVGSFTIVWLTTEVDNQSFIHCSVMSTGVVCDRIGRRVSSRRGGTYGSSQIIQWGYDQTVSPRITSRLPLCPGRTAERHVGSFFVRIAHHSGCDMARWKSRPMESSRRPDGGVASNPASFTVASIATPLFNINQL